MRKKQFIIKKRSPFLPQIEESLVYEQERYESKKSPMGTPSRYHTIEKKDQVAHLDIFHHQLLHSRVETEPKETSHYHFRKYSKYLNHHSHSRNHKMEENLIGIKKDINSLKEIMSTKQVNQKIVNQAKIEQLMHLIRQKKHSMPYSSPSPMPIFYPMPMPMPFPMYPPSPFKGQKYEDEQLEEKHQFRIRNKVVSKNKAKQNLRKLKSIFNAVLFIIYLRRFNEKARKFRLPNFKIFMKEKIKNQLNSLKSVLMDGSKPFLSLLIGKQEVDFEIEKDEDVKISKQKKSSVRKMVNVLIEGISKIVRMNVKKVAMVQPIYFQCKHGSYACQELLLTVEEMEMMCISESFGYISAQKNMEKSNIINLVMIKLLLYGLLLSPQKIDQSGQLKEEIVAKNLFLISSILYELLLNIQDDFMLDVPKSYPLSNYTTNSFQNQIKYLQPIVLPGSTHKEGDLISGLIDETQLKELYKLDEWKEEHRKLKETIEVLHDAIVEYHTKINQKLY